MRFDESQWDLEVDGFDLFGITFGPYYAEFIAQGPDSLASTIRLNGPFELHYPNGETRSVDTDSWDELAALSVLRKDKIRLARISDESALRVEFESGVVITSASASSYEAWEVHGPGDVIVVSTIDNAAPAIWDGRPEAT